MNAPGAILSSTQQWFQIYSKNLANSYRSSGLIEHNVTKGGSRENQILDLLRNLLPKCCEIASDVTIHDSSDRQTAKFDGAILNRWTWPLLYSEGGTVVAPLESVLVALEVKSTLDLDEIADIFKKSRSLVELVNQPGRSPGFMPKTAVFSYRCDNPNLAFLDYAISMHRNGVNSPNLMCLLGSAVMGLAREHGNAVHLTDEWTADSFPVFLRCGADALLLFFFHLSYWASMATAQVSDFKRYVRTAFSTAEAFHFDRYFLDALVANPGQIDKVRDGFKRRGDSGIEALYQEAAGIVGGASL
jgi:hypothetical protein